MTTATWLESLRDTWARLTLRHPQLRWVEKWGVSAGSLVLGLLTLFIFRRGLEYFPWFVGYLILLWLAGVVFAEARQALAARGGRVVWMAVDYAIQSMFHGILLFLLPIYYASTTFASRNMWFLIVLASAALLTTIDPWYRTVLLRFRWVEIVLFGFGLFASLNVAFPLIRIRSTWALLLSGVVSMLALAPVFRRGPDPSWSNAFFRAGMWGVAVALVLWPLRGWIPPVPLHLTRATFTRSVVRLEPAEPASTVTADELRAWGGIAAFTAVAAPAGLREPIYHVWRKNGTEVARIALSPIRGGRPGGFRTYSRKADLGQDATGVWSVDVVTDHGQLIGRARLVVTP